MARQLIKRSFSLAGRRTSVALEQEFWVALEQIALSREQKLTALVAEADAQCPEARPLASALRVLALQAFFPQPSTPAAPNVARRQAYEHHRY
jgi:predicted DNA-binding ribbon-helix-helix protein